jgi:hypothetical protein
LAGTGGREAAETGEEALEVIARYEALLGQFAPVTLGGLVSMLLRLQRIVRRNDKEGRGKEQQQLDQNQKLKGGKGSGRGGRGLHSFTFQLNLSAFGSIGDA